MVEREYINKFEKVVSFYNLDKNMLHDIAKAVSYSESFGTHPISLHGLARSGVASFSDILSGSRDEKLPDTRLMRMLCDTLTIALYKQNKDMFSKSDYSDVLRKVSKKSGVVIGLRGEDYYKTVDECERILNLFESSCVDSKDWDDLLKFDNYISRIVEKLGDKERIERYMEDVTGDYVIPIQTKYVGKYKKGVVCDSKDMTLKLKLATVLAFLCLDIVALSDTAVRNDVQANYMLMKLLRTTDRKIGVFSIVDNVPSFNHRNFKGAKVFIVDKLDKIFTMSKPLDYDDIPFLAAFYDYYFSDNIKVSFPTYLEKYEEVPYEV